MNEVRRAAAANARHGGVARGCGSGEPLFGSASGRIEFSVVEVDLTTDDAHCDHHGRNTGPEWAYSCTITGTCRATDDHDGSPSNDGDTAAHLPDP